MRKLKLIEVSNKNLTKRYLTFINGPDKRRQEDIKEVLAYVVKNYVSMFFVDDNNKYKINYENSGISNEDNI